MRALETIMAFLNFNNQFIVSLKKLKKLYKNTTQKNYTNYLKMNNRTNYLSYNQKRIHSKIVASLLNKILCF